LISGWPSTKWNIRIIARQRITRSQYVCLPTGLAKVTVLNDIETSAFKGIKKTSRSEMLGIFRAEKTLRKVVQLVSSLPNCSGDRQTKVSQANACKGRGCVKIRREPNDCLSEQEALI